MKATGSWLSRLLSLLDGPRKLQARLNEIEKDRTPEQFGRSCAEMAPAAMRPCFSRQSPEPIPRVAALSTIFVRDDAEDGLIASLGK